MTSAPTAPLYAAFREKLLTALPRPDLIYWSGVTVSEEHTEPALAERFQVTEFLNPTIGAEGPIEQNGIYAVTVMEPLANGVADTFRLWAHVDAVKSALRPGVSIDDGNFNPASIIGLEMSGPVQFPTHIQTSLTFRWDRFPLND